MVVSLNSIQTVEIDGTYLSERIVLPEPTGEGFQLRTAEDVTEDILDTVVHEYPRFTKETIDPVDTVEVLSHMKTTIKEKLVATCDDSLSAQETRDVVVPAVEYAFPDDAVISESPDVIWKRPVVVHLLRVLLQTVYDRISTGDHGENTTHMSVENPLEIDEHKLDEVITDRPNATAYDAITWEVESTKAVTVSGSMFTDPVIMPIPNNSTLFHGDAKNGIKQVFNGVIELHDLLGTDSFVPVSTPVFAGELTHQLETAFIDEAELVGSFGKSDINSEIDRIIPDEGEYSEYPDKIYSEDTLLRITRVVVQTLLDQLCHEETHMSVDDPFVLKTNKWDDIDTS